MEAEPEAFTINPEYEKFVPRPSYEQYRSIELDILEHGQLDPIKANPQMVILDGHTRWQILGDRGIKIKYEIIEPEDEKSYIISLNIMRRDLNDFQKIEIMYDYYKKLKLQSRQKSRKIYYDILYSIKTGRETSKDIQSETGYALDTIKKILKGYIDDYTLTRKRGENKTFYYNVNPRGDAILAKGSPANMKGVEILVGKLIGMSRQHLIKGIHLIEKADEDTKNKLRDGIITIGKGYRVFQGRSGRIKGYKTWGKHAKVKCPNCNHIAPKQEYELVW